MHYSNVIRGAIAELEAQYATIGKALENLRPLLDEEPESPATPAPVSPRPRSTAVARQPRRNLAARRPKATRSSSAPSVVDELDQHLRKVCSVCGKTKAVAEFPKATACALGVAGQCKECIAVKARARYAAKKAPAAAAAPSTSAPSARPASSGNRIADLKGIELPFQCAPCRAKFRTQAQLDNHMRVYHTAGAGEDE